MRKIYLCIAIAVLYCAQGWSQPGQLSMTPFAMNFNDPLDIAHCGDERIFVVEKDGVIYILNQQGVRTPTPFLDINARVSSGGSEQGLLGLAFHPHYDLNGYFYVNYTMSGGDTRISRFQVTSNPDIADPNSEEILLTIPQPFANHNGGCMKFGPDGYLWIGMGDGGSGGDPGNRSQNPMELLGKMLRIDVDGGFPYAIPLDNPYYGLLGVANEIWGFGLRNPWRYSFDKVTGDLWIGDVGQNQWEEIHFWAATDTTTANFGWRCYEGNVAYNTNGCQAIGAYDFPMYVFDHSLGSCSVTGGFVYRGARYQSIWGYYFHTDYCSGYLWDTHPDGLGGWITNRSASPFSTFNLASFGEDIYGELYLTGLGNGIIYRLEDTTCTPMAYIAGGDTVYACQPNGTISAFGGPPLTFQWQLAGLDIPGATSHEYAPVAPGQYRVVVSNGSCKDTSNTVTVLFSANPIVDVSVADTSYCIDGPSDTVTVTPQGGILFGPGTSGLVFDPSVAGLGTHTLVYYYVDSVSGCRGVDTLLVSVEVCVGLENPLVTQMQIHPNPSDGSFQLTFHLGTASAYRLEVLDLHGKSLHTSNHLSAGGLVREPLEFTTLAPGIYFLRLQVGEESKVMKFSLF